MTADVTQPAQPESDAPASVTPAAPERDMSRPESRDMGVTDQPGDLVQTGVTERDMSHGSAPSQIPENAGNDLVQKGVTPRPFAGLFGRAAGVTKRLIGIGAKITPYTSAGLRYWRYRWYVAGRALVSYIAPDRPTERSARRITDEQRQSYDKQKRQRGKRDIGASADARRAAAAERKRRERARKRDTGAG